MNIDNNSCNNNNNNNIHINNNDEYNNKLYNSVFNNVYLKRIIFNHLSKFNILYINIKFKSIKEWDQFKYKEYLNNVTFNFNIGNKQLYQLPDNIRIINIQVPTSTNSNFITSIPDQIDSIGLLKLQVDELHSPYINKLIQSTTTSESTSTNINKFKSLTIEMWNGDEIKPNAIPDSITSLYITKNYMSELLNNKIECKLINSLFPMHLKKLVIECVDSYQDVIFPPSLVEVNIKSKNPLIINQFPFNSSLVRLKFNVNYHSYDFDNTIIFPASLQYLETKCRTFTSTLNGNLKILILHMKYYANEIQFPPSLEQLLIKYKYNKLNKDIFLTQESVPCNLSALNLQCSSLQDDNGQPILPDKIQLLIINAGKKDLGEYQFNKALQVNQLPSSLTYLEFIDSYYTSDFNQVIDIGVLPSTLKTLILGRHYSQVINRLAIPSQLELLKISNEDYNHPIDITPSTHPNLAVLVHQKAFFSNNNINGLVLNRQFNSSLSTLQLQDKSQLKYLHLGSGIFNYPIVQSDLPINNQIKTLILSECYTQTINLEYFQNLESIIINGFWNIDNPPNIITTTTSTSYNNYKLKNIIINPYLNKSNFIKQLDSNFYQFIKTNK